MIITMKIMIENNDSNDYNDNENEEEEEDNVHDNNNGRIVVLEDVTTQVEIRVSRALFYANY